MAGFWKQMGKAFVEGWKGTKADSQPTPKTFTRVVVLETPVADSASEQDAEYARQREQWEQERHDREKAMAEGKVMRARALMDAGVDLEQFSEGQVIDDIMNALEFFVPQSINLAVDFADAKAWLDAQNLTKAGKIPKNVVIGRMSVEESEYKYPQDSVIGEVKYMADGSINMIDLHIWHDAIKHSVSIRTVNGVHQITSIDYLDMSRDFRKLLYSEKAPTSSDESMAILNESLSKILK